MQTDPRIEPETGISMAHRFATEIDARTFGLSSENNCRCQLGHAGTTDALLRPRDHSLKRAIWTDADG